MLTCAPNPAADDTAVDEPLGPGSTAGLSPNATATDDTEPVSTRSTTPDGNENDAAT